MESNLCVVSPVNVLWCCDVVSRLNNDIQSLVHDLQILFKLQQCYVGLQKQFDQLYSQLEKRLELLSVKKIQLSVENERITPIHVQEFSIFIRKVWKSLSENLLNENGKARFISYVRGIPLRPVVDDLMDFCFHCSRTLLPKFFHHQCSQDFRSLTNQLNSNIFPEVEFVDSFEQSLKFLTSSLPCLINLITVVDLYLYCPKYDRIETLCNELFTSTPPMESKNFIPSRLLMLPDSLEGDSELGFGDVDSDYVSHWVPNMVSYIMRMSVVPRKFSTISSRPHGILNSNYMLCTRICQQEFPTDGSPGSERKRMNKRRGYKMEPFLILSAILAILLIWLMFPSRMSRMARKIPGPTAYPIVGNIFNFVCMGPKAPECWKKNIEIYGGTFRVWIGPQLHMFLSDPDDIQVILSSQSLIKKSASYNEITPWLGTGLLLSTGKLWQVRRKAITPTFHFKILEEFVPVFHKCSKILIDLFKNKVGKGPFHLTEYISNCALDTIAETAMGTELKAQTNPDSEYPISIFKMTKTLTEKMVNPLQGFEPYYTLSGRKMNESKLLKILFSLPNEVIKSKSYSKTTRDNGVTPSDETLGIKRKTAFLQLLLEMKENKVPAFQTDQDIQDEVITFMFEGHDTTTMSLTFTTWLLGIHQEVQEEVYNEVSGILQDKEEPSMEDYNKMVYLERVIKESLRLYPSVPIIGREAKEDVFLPSIGILVPKGAQLTMPIYALHRREDMFPNAEKFDPDRFLEPIKHPYAYIPFSAGPRNCIGQKYAMLDMKVIISNLVLNYKIKSEKDLIPSPEMILRCEKGPFISVTPRK